ncbi:MAG: AAC(3) family N-acetyltransferase, partial [Lentisphaeria bacterium]|nr:AAC(3) family N-acetyltransferase [Lentisphaeria bacterium]
QYPADGKTAYQDKIMPLGWEATTGKLTVLSGPGLQPGLVAADFQEHPFHLIKGSVGTAPGGEIVRILTYQQALAQADASDALVMTPPGMGPGFRPALTTMLDLGARGLISDFAMNAADEPDGIQWCNAFTELHNWHATVDDRPFIAFSITPNMGRCLRKALDLGGVTARIESDARRFETTVDVVTALVPGRRKEEFWILAHLYEPLSNDNSAGVAAAVETARLLMAAGQPEFSLRVIFGLEYYGFASYAARRGTFLGNEVIGGIDYDAMYMRKEWEILFHTSGPASPFYGNILGDLFSTDLNRMGECPRIEFQNSFACMYDDDSFLSDSTTGIPTVWPIRTGKKKLWHNSKQVLSYVEKDAFACGTALNAAFVSSVISPREELLGRVQASVLKQLAAEMEFLTGSQKEHLTRRYEILKQDLDNFKRCFAAEKIDPIQTALKAEYDLLVSGLTDEIPQSPWRSLVQRIVPVRTKCGFPHDQADVPREKRTVLPGSVLYSPLAAILADMDGKRDLAQIIRMVEHEIRRIIPENELKNLIRAVFHLSHYGYVSLGGFKPIGKAEIVKALRAAGIAEGDCLLVHSSLSVFGEIEAETVIEAFREAVGKTGTFFLPAFNSPFVYIGGPNAWEKLRPYDASNLKAIWTGTLPRTLIAKYPEAVRSAHYSHSWVGLGPLAKEACSAQAADEPPMSVNSVPEFALRHNGKVVHFGNTIGSTTFLHLLEDRLDLPGLETALCKVKQPDGSLTTAAIPRNLPYDRD